MARCQPIDTKILEASKTFDAHLFASTIKSSFVDFLDYRRNQKRILYSIWDLSLIVLCGCNTIEEIAKYAYHQQEWFSSIL
ncbi:hypothetical protein [Rhabdochlamydiaceae symbiont of Dictyostelium giganteum]|uniref:hypothetical protein n=1 Tax=Rhabdochlamydiaceae symbiont of Dictyostelium giganteum TaxID=3342349 RepID=UPI0038515487